MIDGITLATSDVELFAGAALQVVAAHRHSLAASIELQLRVLRDHPDMPISAFRTLEESVRHLLGALRDLDEGALHALMVGAPPLQ